jgi:hypothetical protein
MPLSRDGTVDEKVERREVVLRLCAVRRSGSGSGPVLLVWREWAGVRRDKELVVGRREVNDVERNGDMRCMGPSPLEWELRISTRKS